MAALPFSGLQEVVASVSDPKRVARVFVEIGGWSVCRLPDAPREQWQAWRVPRHYRRIEQWLLVPANAIKGWVRLVKFHGVAQRIMRSSGRTWDTGGIFDVDVFTPDVRRVYRALQAHGWSAYGDPVDYGWLAWRFPVADAQAHAATLAGRGAELLTAPARLRIAPYGTVVAFSVRTPDGAILEFFERDGRTQPALRS